MFFGSNTNRQSEVVDPIVDGVLAAPGRDASAMRGAGVSQRLERIYVDS